MDEPDSLRFKSSITGSWNRLWITGFDSNTTPPPIVSIGE